MKRLFATICTIFFLMTSLAAQSDKEVSLVTSGIAPTEQEATLVALRSAIGPIRGVLNGSVALDMGNVPVAGVRHRLSESADAG